MKELPKPIETTVSEQIPIPNKQPYENFKIVNNDDLKFYKTRSVKVEEITFNLK